MNTTALESHLPFSEEDVILYFTEDIEFHLNSEARISNWLKMVIARESCTLTSLSFIFCSDTYLHQINVEYLNHDTLTDVISFPYTEPPIVQGDIFMSIDRIRENAGNFGVDFETELRRVLVHGVLHFCGYKDKTESEAQLMRQKEDEMLQLFHHS